MQWIAPSEKDTANGTLEKRLWDAADQFRANSELTPAQYSQPVLGVIFLRFAEVRFTAQAARLEKTAASSRRGSRVDDPTAHHAEGVLYLTPEARYDYLLALPEASDVGKAINDAMRAIEKHNPPLAGVLPKTYNIFTSTLLKELLKKVSEIPASVDYDALGRIYEYFLGEFAREEGRMGGEFYTPSCIVRLITDILETLNEELERLNAQALYCGSVVYCPEKFWASDNTLVAFPANDEFHTKFLFYLLYHTKLSAYAGGVAQPLVTQTVLKQVEVMMPSLPVQQRIAGILWAYDELVENSQRQIWILEAMARALYREWFVLYRFPGHERVPRVASSVGDIPQGWEVKKLSEVACVNKAQISLRTAPEEVHYIDISSVSPGQINAITTYAFADSRLESTRAEREIVGVAGDDKPRAAARSARSSR